MGWLFGKKKVPKVPMPEARPFDEGALRFPSKVSSDRIIQPEQLKQAAGVMQPLHFPSEDNDALPQMEDPMPDPQPQMKSKNSTQSGVMNLPRSPVPFESADDPLFVQVEVYREVLGAVDGLKHDLLSLHETNKTLETSEYNEDTNFTKLRKGVKGIHDRLLQMDKILFKM